MEYRILGQTGIKVSRLCFGALTVGPLQAALPVDKGAAVIRRALEAGVNFIDTAECYQTYPYIYEATRGWAGEVVIASKSYAYSWQGMRQSLEGALRALRRDYIDIFLLHEQESALTIRGHWEAVEYLLTAKKEGLVRAIGVSTHSVEGVRAAARIAEFDIIHPIINIAGIGIQGGTREDMLAAIAEAASFGKGIYGMKALGGGHLIPRAQEALAFVLGIPQLASVAVGMRTVAEVDFNVAVFSGMPVPSGLWARVGRQKRRLHIEDWCRGCGSCVERCGAGALFLTGGRAAVDPLKCRLCGYCGTVCPDFCIKIV
ncbi:aldo/keto reductase [Desulfofundulus sp. TPOSR]|uniref:Aldo/keto reductase n=1 Tax=Desulfofundulus kuznetsovii (strain DSM 6115 / VKM B-1805 / 17) TaxID=760568 RepID=A0AAU8PWN5_DESK7|nr:aldo/keto reductase [Desulfofundulus sp. TPOSR]AEG15579.1 aldo/keto reductase [Desulfofundulus kuznetsovii DSM 6115]NHM27758.1 aldo/keto reductase [Desulfofundulus sp. TPOSR]